MRIPAVLSGQQLSKRYGGIQALDQVDIDLYPGKVVALAGQNGAGKSTLVKIISGAVQPDSGVVLVDEAPLKLDSVPAAQLVGIRVVHQVPALALDLSVLDNIFLGSESVMHRRLGRLARLNRKQMRHQVQPLMETFAPHLNLDRRLWELRAHERRLVGIIKALANSARVLILDEPTAALPADERILLLDTVLRLKQEGLALLYVSHHLEEIEQIADEVVVLRDGRLVGHEIGAPKAERIVSFMLGQGLTAAAPQSAWSAERQLERPAERTERAGFTFTITPPTQVHQVLDVVDPVVLELGRGEITVLTGLVGSGISDVGAAMFGARVGWHTEFRDGATTLTIRSAHQAIALGIGYLSDDRIGQSTLPDLTIRKNISIAALKGLTNWMGRIDQRNERRRVHELCDALQMRRSHDDQGVTELSGGNQQKAMIGRWLFAASRILLLNEPTQGIDVIAKAEVMQILARFADQGGCVLIITTDASEFMPYAVRTLVIRGGHIVADLSGASLTGSAVAEAIVKPKQKEDGAV